MDTFLAGAIFLIAYALIASERFDRTLIALLGGLLVVVFGIIDQELPARQAPAHALGIGWV